MTFAVFDLLAIESSTSSSEMTQDFQERPDNGTVTQIVQFATMQGVAMVGLPVRARM
jgi:hypothetical protein